ncbi:MAG: cyclase family protein [Caldisphaera sp.]
MINITGCKILDLTHEFYHGMPGWPTHPILEVNQLKILNIDGYNVKQLIMNTHHGTHVDAAAHMIEDGKTLDQYPLEKFMGEGVVVKITNKNDGEGITDDDLKKFTILNGDMVYLYTGWSKFRGFNKKYLYRWPYLLPSGAKYLVERNIKVVGIDGLSIGAWGGNTAASGPVENSAVEVHQILLKQEIIIVEEVANLDQVLGNKLEARAYFIMLPLKIKDSDGSPVRLIAIMC